MYHYIQDKEFLKRLKGTCSDIVNQLVQSINNDSVMTVKACLVGSGAKNLITQNENEPIDLDYNLCIVSTKSINMLDSRAIKEYIRKQFNKVLSSNGWGDCQDSTSAFTTEKRVFKKGNQTAFKIDIAITCKYLNNWQRLIHQKTGLVILDGYYWNEVKDSGRLEEKVRALKSEDLWDEVRDTYLEKKNFYLCKNDHNHPSFIVYVETVNQIYNKYFWN
ncbi:hypothetical protein [Bacteroides acidifaciens]|uniref:hypothetical protein n=1 Tax=Bacteroides acidifaciens TaxID=85831 RepID=UPI0025B0FBD0|nr:hypothetical protein [Bacteroides acidifaciens]